MPSIYEAEIRHKSAAKTVEDQLTSRVFGALAMLPKDKVLLPLLRCLADVLASQEKDIVLSKLMSSQPQRISLDLWKYSGTNYPDVYIELDDTALVIEVKKDSKPTVWQITDQYQNTKDWLNKKNGRRGFIYFLLTNDDTEPDEVASAQKKLQPKFPNAQIHWIRWPQIWKWLREISKSQRIDGIAKGLLDTTIELLEAENMSGQTGFKMKWFSDDVIKAIDKVQELCGEISATLGEVIAKLSGSGIEYFDNNFPPIRSDTRKNRLHNPDEWILRNFDFYFKDKDWRRVKNGEKDPCLYITFWLESDKTGVDVGFWWCSPHEDDKETIIEQCREKAQKDGLRTDEDFWAEAGGISVFRRFSPEDLENDKNIVDTLKTRLVEMRDFAEEIATLQKYLGYRKKTQARREK